VILAFPREGMACLAPRVGSRSARDRSSLASHILAPLLDLEEPTTRSGTSTRVPRGPSPVGHEYSIRPIGTGFSGPRIGWMRLRLERLLSEFLLGLGSLR